MLEAEKTLKKYPNNFEVVYASARVYMLKFTESKEEQYMHKSNELFQDAISLLYQNNENSISETTILNCIGQNYLTAGQMEKGIGILEENNICDINSAHIGFTYSMMKQPDKAKKYLFRSYMNIMNSTIHTMAGIMFMYAQQKNKLCIDAGLCLVDYFDSIKEEEGSIVFIDKIKAVLLAQIAVLEASFGNYNEAERFIIDAYKLAKKFDAAPIYTTKGTKFFDGEENVQISLDGLGETAIDGIYGLVFANAEPSEALESVKRRFEELKNEAEK